MIKLIFITISFYIVVAISGCTENPKDSDPTSTITPGNHLKVDNATAHSNNVDSITLIKRNNGDSSHGNNKNPGTKSNGVIEPSGSTKNDNSNIPH